MNKITWLTLIIAFWLPFSMQAVAASSALERLGQNGCVWQEGGAFDRSLSDAERKEFQAFMDDAVARSEASREGDYVVFNDGVCEIKPPNIESHLSLDDPDIQAIIRDPHEYLQDGQDDGCFIISTDIRKLLTSRGMDEDAVENEFFRFYASHIISGEIRFYQEDIYRTPVSFQVVSEGACQDVNNIEALDESHERLLANYSDFVRLNQNAVICGTEEGYRTPYEALDYEARLGLDHPNFGANMEYYIIFIAQGWLGDIRAHEKPDNPRPPICHY